MGFKVKTVSIFENSSYIKQKPTICKNRRFKS